MRQRWSLATFEDVKDVSQRLRTEDIEECYALRGVDARWWVPANYTPGSTYVIFNSEGENVAIAGVDYCGRQSGLIWMLATPLLLNHQIEFLKYSKAWIEEVTRPYQIVGNVIHAANEVHLKWLKWCGFTFVKRHDEFGFGKEPFYEFVRITPCA